MSNLRDRKWESVVLSELSATEQYKLLTGVVIPRPIALISTVDEFHASNLAPYSFFNVVSHAPPLVVVSVAMSEDCIKDTQTNIERAGEFVVGIPSRDLFGEVDLCGYPYPQGEDEFVLSGLTKVPAQIVSPPLIGEVAVNLECRLADSVALLGGRYQLLVGEVCVAHVRDNLRNERGHIDAVRLDPLSRLGGRQYSGIEGPIQGLPAG